MQEVFLAKLKVIKINVKKILNGARKFLAHFASGAI
jgi:hypothetical protein